MALAVQAEAVIMGDRLSFVANETAPANAPAIATGIVTVGAPTATPGFFTVAGFNLSTDKLSGNACVIPCRLPNPNLTGLKVDAATLGVVGDLTGTFPGQHGGAHSIDLALADVPPGTWTFTDNHTGASGGVDIRSASGTYQVSAVPEPSSLYLLGSGLVALTRATWRRAALRSLRARPS